MKTAHTAPMPSDDGDRWSQALAALHVDEPPELHPVFGEVAEIE